MNNMNHPPTMKAAQYFRYGPPEVLQVNEVPVPTPGRGELLLRVISCSVNRADAIARSGGTRLTNGFRFPKGTGVDVLGEVAAQGENSTTYSIGEVVWGYVGMVTMGTSGTAAQYATIKDSSVSLAPQLASLEEAAALPLVAMTALQALRNRLKIKSGARILIIGASGGVGSAAVQIARKLGAEVASVSGESNAELCRDLGASATFSHQNLPNPGSKVLFDAIFDCTGIKTGYYRRYLKGGGRMVTIAPGGILAVLGSQLSSRRVSFLPVKVVPRDLFWLSSAVTDGSLRPVIDHKYPLSEISLAHTNVAAGHTRGKSIIIL